MPVITGGITKIIQYAQRRGLRFPYSLKASHRYMIHAATNISMITMPTRLLTGPTRSLLFALALLYSTAAFGQGVIPVALAQQSDANGRPLSGALLYIYQVGTVATPQNSFQDFGLTLVNPWPLPADSTGRIPMFYLANGAVHVRLTDATGVVIFDYPTMQVVGPSTAGGGGGGGGGGGPSIDPTTIAAVGDIKFRITANESVAGWIRVNGRTIGSAASGGTERANPDTQNLFTYLWINCSDAHCPVVGGRGTTAAADFAANRAITLPDWRGRTPVGLDDMGNVGAGRLVPGVIFSGGGDGVTTPGATGGESVHALGVTELAVHNHTATQPAHAHQFTYTHVGDEGGTGVAARVTVVDPTSGTTSVTTQSATPSITVGNTGSGAPHDNMPPFMLGTWFMKL
jgi:microcystin-dependent protein